MSSSEVSKEVGTIDSIKDIDYIEQREIPS